MKVVLQGAQERGAVLAKGDRARAEEIVVRMVEFKQAETLKLGVELAVLMKLAQVQPRLLTLASTKDLEIALRVVDRVTVMHNARVLKHGSPAEIENDAEVQAIYMGERVH